MGEAKQRDKGVYRLPPWTPFEEAVHVPPSDIQMAELARNAGVPIEDVHRVFHSIATEEMVLKNSRYQVSVRRVNKHVAHLSIKRLDRRPLGIEHFRDLQRIKNELIGPECVAVEVYPPESQLVDTSNQYHLWVFIDPSYRLPFGLGDARAVLYESAGGARQLPLEED